MLSPFLASLPVFPAGFQFTNWLPPRLRSLCAPVCLPLHFLIPHHTSPHFPSSSSFSSPLSPMAPLLHFGSICWEIKQYWLKLWEIRQKHTWGVWTGSRCNAALPRLGGFTRHLIITNKEANEVRGFFACFSRLYQHLGKPHLTLGEQTIAARRLMCFFLLLCGCCLVISCPISPWWDAWEFLEGRHSKLFSTLSHSGNQHTFPASCSMYCF